MPIKRVSISGPIREVFLHVIVICVSIKLYLFCYLFKNKTDPKTCFFSKEKGFFQERGLAENTYISSVTQRKHGVLNSMIFPLLTSQLVSNDT